LCCFRCGHCKELAPIYEDLGKAFRLDKKRVVIAKIDGADEIELSQQYKVESYPTLIFFPADASQPHEMYKGPRELDAMVDYVNEMVGLHRQTDGQLKWSVGLVDALDKLLGANGYPPGCRGKPLNKAFVENFNQTVQGLEGRDGEVGRKYYLPAVVKIAEHGVAFIDEEIKRLTALINDKKVDDKKRTDLELKKNIYLGCLHMLVGR
jgi:protein disulfide-isomerase A6